MCFRTETNLKSPGLVVLRPGPEKVVTAARKAQRRVGGQRNRPGGLPLMRRVFALRGIYSPTSQPALWFAEQASRMTRAPTRIALVAGWLWLCAMSGRAELLVSSFGGNEVRRFNQTNGAALGTFIANGTGGLFQPHQPVFGPDNHLYVASAGTDEVLKFDGTNGAFLGVFVVSNSGGLNYPVDLVFHTDGRLYVGSQQSSQVLRYDGATGAFVDVFVTNGSGGLTGPSGIAFGPDGNLYTVSRFGNSVQRFNGTNGAWLGAFITNGTGGLSQPFGCRFGPDGNLYVVSGNSNKIARFDPTGAYLGDFVTNGSGGLSLPVGLEFGPDGRLYVASLNNGKIAVFNGTNGNFISNFVAAGAAPGANFFTFRPDRTIVPPQLDVARSNASTVVSWPAVSTNFVLQSRTNLDAAAWTNWTSPPALVGIRFVITDADAVTSKFYRLRNSSGAGP